MRMRHAGCFAKRLEREILHPAWSMLPREREGLLEYCYCSRHVWRKPAEGNTEEVSGDSLAARLANGAPERQTLVQERLWLAADRHVRPRGTRAPPALQRG